MVLAWNVRKIYVVDVDPSCVTTPSNVHQFGINGGYFSYNFNRLWSNLG